MEFLIGGLAGMTAVVFSNPFEVVKTRMQLQGELMKQGEYSVHYRGPFHAAFVIARADGLRALQRGLAPAMMYQLFMNSTRLGIYQTAENNGLTKNKKGKVSLLNSTIVGAASGGLGCFIASPFNLIKTQMQASSNIAVGEQHKHKSLVQAVVNIAKEGGVLGLYRGSRIAAIRIAVGGSIQITSYAVFKEYLHSLDVLRNSSTGVSVISSILSGAAVSLGASPLDVILTRLYNQPVDKDRKGKLYKGIIDCGTKILRTEGIYGLYKGVIPLYFKSAPHIIMLMFIWEKYKNIYKEIKQIR